jgi:hypothetical protein
MKDETTFRLPLRNGMSRNQAVDFFRGLGLCLVFVNHLRPNVWAHFTPAQFGFSDFAEIFVFLSGYVSASMYERTVQSGGIIAAVGKFRTRFAKLYVAHIVSLVTSLAILGAFASHGLRLDDSDLYVWMENPAQYLWKVLFLLYSPGLFGLLPLYLLLSPVALIAVIALRRWPALVLASSFTLWWVAQTGGRFDFPFMQEIWFFQPFAWQFLLVIGAASQMYWSEVTRIAGSRTLQSLAIVIVLTGFLLGMARLIRLTPAYAHLLFYNVGKRHLAPIRLAHFLGLLILIIAIPYDWQKWRETRGVRLAMAGGRHSLFIYSVTLVMAVTFNLLLKGLNGGPLLQLACTALGLCVLCGIAAQRDKPRVKRHLQSEQA